MVAQEVVIMHITGPSGLSGLAGARYPQRPRKTCFIFPSPVGVLTLLSLITLLLVKDAAAIIRLLLRYFREASWFRSTKSLPSLAEKARTERAHAQKSRRGWHEISGAPVGPRQNSSRGHSSPNPVALGPPAPVGGSAGPLSAPAPALAGWPSSPRPTRTPGTLAPLSNGSVPAPALF